MSPLDKMIENAKLNLASMEAQRAAAGPVLSPQQQIDAQLARFSQAAPPPPPPPAVPVQAVDNAVVLQILMGQIRQVFVSVLTPEQIENMRQHVMAGAPGIAPFMGSEAIKSLALLVHDTYIDFLSGKEK